MVDEAREQLAQMLHEAHRDWQIANGRPLSPLWFAYRDDLKERCRAAADLLLADKAELGYVDADRRVIQCNFAESTKVASAGARAYVVLTNPGNAHDRIVVLVRSRGGRWVEKWEDIRHLKDFRVKTLPPEHPLYANERIGCHGEAEMECDRLVAARERSQKVGER